MIKPTELRISNWVIINDSPGAERAPYEYQIESSQDLAKMESFDDPKDNGVEGIPLTPEVLERCGFTHGLTMERGNEINKCWSTQIANSAYLEYRNEDWYIQDEFSYSATYMWNAPRFLHQLQNLLFCLCGSKLNINL